MRNRKLKELLYTCDWENIHWDYFVITMQFLFKKRQRCYRIKLTCKPARSAKYIFYGVTPGFLQWHYHVLWFLALRRYFLFIIIVVNIKSHNYK